MRTRSIRFLLTPRLRRAASGFALTLAGMLAAGSAAPAAARAQSPGTEAYAEYDASHTDELGLGNLVTVTISDPGQSDPTTILLTDTLVATHGQHDITVQATAHDGGNGVIYLRGEGMHVFSADGTNPTSDVWRRFDSQLLARAKIVDDLTLSGVPTATATVELYWDLAGHSDMEIDLAPPGDVFYDFRTAIRLDGVTSAPNSGGGVHSQEASWFGYLNGDTSDSKFIDEQVVMGFAVDPSATFHFEATFEVEPLLDMNNGVELGGTLFAQGYHHGNYHAAGAKLVGIVVRDALGNIVPNALVDGATAYEYPVLTEVPPPHVPERTILSPVAVIANDLGEYSASYGEEKMIDQSGLAVPFTSGVTGFDAYISGTSTPWGYKQGTVSWVSLVDYSLPVQGTLDFDLGASYLVDRLAIWSVTLGDVSVQVAEDLAGPWTDVGQYSLPNNNYWYNSYPHDLLDFGAEYPARYVRLQIDSAHPYSSTDTYAYAIVGEIAASAKVIPLPEPGTPTMAAFGIAALALLQRRRMRGAAARARGARA